MTPIRLFALGLSASYVLIGCQKDPVDHDIGGDDGINTFGSGGGDDSSNPDDGDTETGNGDGDGDGEADPAPDPEAGDGDGDSDEDDSEPSGTKFDLLGIPDGNANTSGCLVPDHDPCDIDSIDPWHAMGVNCPGEYQVDVAYTGAPAALYVHSGQLGTANPATYPPLEGDKMVILSSGNAQQLTQAGAYASTSHPGYDPVQLPPPLSAVPVGQGQDCNDDPTLIGKGDCSNTVQVQWAQGNGAYDYAELRMTGEVPMGVSGFSYNFAFFSSEYPVYYKTSFNDMYIAWLESEIWTGNISFDEMGNPISLNAGFLDYKDAPNNHDCPDPCKAPELQGTAMQGHAATKWLATTAGVVPGEEFTLVFAIFDLSDNILDSVVTIDNFQWNCIGGPPVTIPG